MQCNSNHLFEFNHINCSDLSTLSRIFEIIPCHIFCKDLQGYYLSCNKYMVKDLGLSQEAAIIGLNDKALIWNKYSNKLIGNDAHVLETQQHNIFVEPVILENQDLVELQSYKYPLYKESQLIGVFGISFVRSNNLLQRNEAAVPKIRLSARQIECIKLLIIGMSIKAIAKTLKLSPRTVESHLELARKKLHSPNNTKLVAICLESYRHIFCTSSIWKS